MEDFDWSDFFLAIIFISIVYGCVECHKANVELRKTQISTDKER